MLTIAGGIVLGFLALGVLGAVFGGPSQSERLQLEAARMRAQIEAGEARQRAREK